MNRAIDKKGDKGHRDYGWVVEVLILLTVTPALVHGVLSLQNLPIV